MRRLLEQKFFPFVVRPGRYAGGEPGQIVKDPHGRVNYLHCYPDKYEIGQSYVGLQSLYHIVNQDDRFLCERAFAVDADAEELMRRENIPLFSLESSRPADQFEAIGFTLVDEMVATNMLAMIDLAGIPIHSCDRSDEAPLILAGGPAVYNPDPLAEFVDLFFIGDAEEGLPEILTVLLELKGKTRLEKLRAIVERVESVYVPRFYDKEAHPLHAFAPEKIKARLIETLKPEYYPERPLVPLVETVHDHLGVEIMRGCPQGCKFCFAGPIYRPIRARSTGDITRQVETQLDNTGYDTVSLLALSATDYPELEPLVASLSRKLEPQRVSISLPSLRPGSVSPQLLKTASAVRRFGLTIAPEAGTERLRLFIRKDFPDEAIFDTARVAFANGWNAVKLYFMVGLPSETEEDLIGIATLCRKVLEIGRGYTGKASVNVTLSPFVPKAHTPFQWDEALPEDEIFARINFIKRLGRSGPISYRHNSSQTAMLAALIGRGGRDVGDVIETAFKMGCRFDSWGEVFKFDKWTEAFRQHGLDTALGMKAIPFTERLPWAHISKGPSIEHLIKQRKETSLQLQPHVPHSDTRPTQPEVSNETGGFGRGKKRAAPKAQVAPTKNRVRLRWSKSARFKYMSHLENLRLMERALRRARMPVAYSLGHNPSMKLSLGPPLPLGFTSEAEFIDITLETQLMTHMVEELGRQLPKGIIILDARSSLGKKASLNAMLNRADYTLPLDAFDDRTILQNEIDELLAAESLECARGAADKRKTVDIRSAVFNLEIVADELQMTLGLGESGYAKPTELIAYLNKGLTVAVEALPFHRKALYRVDRTGNRIEAMDL